MKIEWKPAKGPSLLDHKWGDLCLDANGALILIGDAIDDYEYDQGCGCCSERVTSHSIVAYCNVISWEDAKTAARDRTEPNPAGS